MSEAIIKQHLDGWFFRVDGTKVIAKQVPKDHIPDHKPAMTFDVVPDTPRTKHHRVKPFTPDEDETILRMRAEGRRWEIIATEMARGISCLRQRYADLCVERGMPEQAARPVPPSRLSAENKKEIVRLRELGMTFTEINQLLGIKGYAARDFYSRHVQRKRAEREAA